ncbi:hypothetical protein Aduo_005078 [Ancylostoma duodenale]
MSVPARTPLRWQSHFEGKGPEVRNCSTFDDVTLRRGRSGRRRLLFGFRTVRGRILERRPVAGRAAWRAQAVREACGTFLQTLAPWSEAGLSTKYALLGRKYRN